MTTLHGIARTVTSCYGLTVDDIRQHSQVFLPKKVRQLTAWLMWEMVDAPPAAIGEYLGHNDDYVFDCVAALRNRIEKYPEVRQELDALRLEISRRLVTLDGDVPSLAWKRRAA